MDYSYKYLGVRVLAAIFVFALFIPLVTKGQGCPQFEIKKVVDTNQRGENGSVEITIRSSKAYSTENFDIRQKEKQVTGALDYNVDMRVTRNSLRVTGLKKSEALYLEEYVILFSDKSCDNGRLVEVGTFKIN